MQNFFYVFIFCIPFTFVQAQNCPTSIFKTVSSNSDLFVNSIDILPSFGTNTYVELFDANGDFYYSGLNEVELPCIDEQYFVRITDQPDNSCYFQLGLSDTVTGVWSAVDVIPSNNKINVVAADFLNGIFIRSRIGIEINSDVCIPFGELNIIPTSFDVCNESSVFCPSQVSFNLPNVTGNHNDVICLDLPVSGFNNFVAFQYSLNWNPNYLQYDSCLQGDIASYTCGNISLAGIGELRSFWIDFSGATLNNGDNLITLCWKVISSQSVSTNISFSNRIPIEFLSLTDENFSVCQNGGTVSLN